MCVKLKKSYKNDTVPVPTCSKERPFRPSNPLEASKLISAMIMLMELASAAWKYPTLAANLQSKKLQIYSRDDFPLIMVRE